MFLKNLRDQNNTITIVDNINRFRHIKYPQVIVQNPKHTFVLREVSTKKTLGVYGSIGMPDKKDILRNVMHLRVFENCDISYESYNPCNYEIVVDGRLIWGHQTKIAKNNER